MKTYLYILLTLSVLTCGCVENKKEELKSKDTPAKIKDTEPIDYASVGMEKINPSGSIKEIICQTWDFKEDAEDAMHADPESNMDIVYRGCSFFSDGTMIKNPRGNMETGTWSLDKKVNPFTITFLLPGKTEIFQVPFLSVHEMEIGRQGLKGSVTLIADGARYVDIKRDPFYISNNGWRIKPAKPESDEEIKKRLKDCLQFFVLFYEEKINTKSKIVSFIGLPSCFKWYGGGIYIQKKNEINTKWLNLFYNSEQAMKAYKLADKLMEYRYEWPKKERNWLKLNLAVLKQMIAKLDSL